MPTSPILPTLWHHAWTRRALRTFAALLMLWVVAWAALPPLLRWGIAHFGSQALGRPVAVGAVDVRPWSLELTLRELAIGGASPEVPPLLTVDRLYVDAELQSLLRLAPVVDALTIETPHLRLTHLGDGRYDIDDILARLARPDQPDTGPARLALYNLVLSGGEIDLEDQATGSTHALRNLALQIPFLSTLPSQRSVQVQPHLAFTLGDSHFDTRAQATPFAEVRQGEVTLHWEGLDLADYKAYLPASLPVQVEGATLAGDLTLAFVQGTERQVALRGKVQATDLRLADRTGQPLFAADQLAVELGELRPLDRVVQLKQITLQAPVVHAKRQGNGQINWLQLASSPAKPAAEPKLSTAPAATQASPPGWTVQVAQARIGEGQIHWKDQTTQPAAAISATGLALDLHDIAWPLEQPLRFEGSLALEDRADAKPQSQGGLRFQGEVTLQKAQAQLTLKDLGLPLAKSYLAAFLVPEVEGQLNGELALQWQAPPKTQPSATGLTVAARQLTLDQAALRQGDQRLASLGQLALNGLALPLDRRSLSVESLALTDPELAIERDREGRWMVERWLKTAEQPAAHVTPVAPTETAPAASPWQVALGTLAVTGGSVTWKDDTPTRPVAFGLAELNVDARQLALDGKQPSPFKVSARMVDGRTLARLQERANTAKTTTPPAHGDDEAPRASTRSGSRLSLEGSLALSPLALRAKIDANRLPLHTLDGYLSEFLALQLVRAQAGFRGEVDFAQRPQGLALRLQGDAALDRLQARSTGPAANASAARTAQTPQAGEELLAWDSLGMRGVKVAIAPRTAPQIAVQETSLANFYARVVLNDQGKLNLSELVKPANGSGSAPTTAAMATATAPAITAPAPDTLAPVLQFGPMSLVNGQVLFSDFFIKPNYRANLTELTGKLSAFSSVAPSGTPVLADLELRGKAEGTASLEITGKLNPLAKPLALDIQSKVRDLELSPLTPYAIKYAGHGIESGKLSMDVAYQVQPDGQLTASNRLTLNQLTFGDPVEGAPNSLPVRLAVGLLADRDGVINLDLPLSGSLNDPEFRIGPIIFKVIVNLIGKALTSPFALLASALGGDEDLDHVTFAPGSAELSASARKGLDKIVQALTERPNLKLTVTGQSSLARERDGVRRSQLDALILAEKRRRNPGNTEPVQAAEYPTLLRAVYRNTDMPKPRNLVGLTRDLPPAEMETLLLSHLPATEVQASALAQRRAEAVRAYLAEQQLGADRLVLTPPQTGAQEDTWTPRAQLNLSMP